MPGSIADQPNKRQVRKQPKPKKRSGVATRQKATAKKTTKAGRRPLSGAVFYLASGHGGPDPGAIGRFGRFLLPEDEYAYDVTIRLSELLKQQGATVYMMVKDPNDGIRNDAVLKLDRDERAYPNQPIPLNQTARLRQTTTAVNRLYARHKGAYQRLITIHVDSRSKGQNIDVFFYHHSGSAVGRRLATHIHRRFQTNYRRYQPGRPYSGTVSTRNTLYVVKNSHPPTVFIELGNIQNRQDQRRFVIASNRQALANWMAQGILDDYRSR
ncbi:N-acetylmuramoyl-L-alanine amidase [Fibrisoma montanum]|uniref:N-acetylmuramoyl-L-alanine amidase n=1 Tax=Fibrisoma montanum TaxID=2305895 RepID=A0A418M2V5_9BACT|nr:N-acetylmuramoyl-L-alanine amidase [Fibrisoma montanum]